MSQGFGAVAPVEPRRSDRPLRTAERRRDAGAIEQGWYRRRRLRSRLPAAPERDDLLALASARCLPLGVLPDFVALPAQSLGANLSCTSGETRGPAASDALSLAGRRSWCLRSRALQALSFAPTWRQIDGCKCAFPVNDLPGLLGSGWRGAARPADVDRADTTPPRRRCPGRYQTRCD